MSIFKCKMCGGDLNIIEGESVCTCEYCGTKQTVPKLDDDKKATLFARANRLRLANEFDKAYSIYENIVEQCPEEAEAYWGLVLCKYGIEYVDDPATAKKIPTCHRSSFDSIMEDSDFEQVMENSDPVARKVYREEAKVIEEIRKGIIEVSGKEQPYDIFICYKETNDDGERTIDSVLAQDIYDILTQKGYRVFFSRITLEDKLGQEYEPYIFAALNSAKIMLAFGTDYDYYNAVWVKNEWSRFLKLMEKDKTKRLIPCFKNIDAYDIPKEFAKLQAQDLGKVGADQDLIRGIDKLLGANSNKKLKQAPTPNQTYSVNNISALLDRGFMALEDKEWQKADGFFEEVLNQDSRCAKAYLGKLLVDSKLSKKEDLPNMKNSFFSNNNYKRILSFGDEELKNELGEYINQINDRNRDIFYNNTMIMVKGVNIITYNDVVKRLKSLGTYKDSAQILEDLENKNEKGEIKFLLNPNSGLDKSNYQKMVYASSYGTCVINPNGTLSICGDICNNKLSYWNNIYQLALNDRRIVGLKYDGTVVNSYFNDVDEDIYTADLKDIVCVGVGLNHILALDKNGKLNAIGYNYNGECDISSWHNVVQIACGYNHSVGITSDGRVYATGDNTYHQCDVENWTNIIEIDAGAFHTVGLRADGTVVATGNYHNKNSTTSWRNVCKIVAGRNNTFGILNDGSLVVAGSNEKDIDLSGFSGVIDVSGGVYHTNILTCDGVLHSIGKNTYEQCNFNNARLFNNYAELEIEKSQARSSVDSKQLDFILSRMDQGLCPYCGGTFKGLFTKRCSKCGREKDY